MPINDFTEDDPRLTAGRLFLQSLHNAQTWLEQLELTTDILLTIREQVSDNNPPIFQPEDLPFVNAELIALRNAIQAYVDSLPGSPN